MKFVKHCVCFIMLFLFTLLKIFFCRDSVLNDLIDSFDNKTHIYDLISKKTKGGKDLFREKTLKIIEKINEKFSFQSYIYILPKTMKVKSKFNSLANFTQEYWNVLSDKNQIVANKTVLISFREKNIKVILGTDVRNKMKHSEEIIKDMKNKARKDINSGYHYSLFNLMKKILNSLNSNNNEVKNVNHPVLYHRNSLRYNKEKSDMIKSIILLPFIILICYHYFTGKIIFKEPKLDIDLKKITIKKIEKKELADKSCIICLEDFIQKSVTTEKETRLLVKEKPLFNEKIMKLECEHTFHPGCILKWLKKQKKCPTCRTDIDANNVNLYQMV